MRSEASWSSRRPAARGSLPRLERAPQTEHGFRAPRRSNVHNGGAALTPFNFGPPSSTIASAVLAHGAGRVANAMIVICLTLGVPISATVASRTC